MFGNGTSLRHLPFFEEVAAHEEHQAEWRAATAGLVTLRLVDAWIEEGPSVAAPDSFMVNAVRKAIDKMDDGSTVPGILGGIVDAIQRAAPGDTHLVLPRLLAYGRVLEHEARWKVAVDVYDTVIAHAHPREESDSAIVAHHRRAISLQSLDRLDDAVLAYSTSGAVAEAAGDMIGVLRAGIGQAIIAMLRGNLPQADHDFERIANQAAELGLVEQQAEALGNRAAVAGYRGMHEVAVQFAYDALRVSRAPQERDRILNNLGTAFHLLGIRSAARDAFLVLSVTAVEQYTRWAAMLSLMTLAAEDGAETTFEQIRRSITTGSMPPDMKVDYFIHLGKARRALQQEHMAEIAFSKAIEIAEAHGLGRLLFEAESELRASQYAIEAMPSKEPPPALVDVADAIRTMRLETLVTQDA